MEIEFIEKSQKEEWNKFIIGNGGSFLQSFEWGEFQTKFGKKVWRLAVKERGGIIIAAQAVKEKMKFKNYLYIPYGPVFSLENSKAFTLLLDEIKKIGKGEGSVFLRIEPNFSLPLSDIKLKKQSKRLQPEKTLVLDLIRGEEELLKSFEKRTRYNIRLAEKKGVKVNILNNYSKDFYKLLTKTKERQEFKSYSESYYKKLLETKGEHFQVRLFEAEYEGKPIVATLAVFFGNRVTTLHTGFDYSHRSLKAPYLVRWSIMLDGKKEGKSECDFWGIDEKKWPGVTHLKRSFNGREIEYPEGREMVFNPFWYFLYNIFRIVL